MTSSQVPDWAQLVGQSALSFSAESALPEAQWFERLATAPAANDRCLIRTYPPFDPGNGRDPVWTLYLPPEADLDGPVDVPQVLAQVCLVQLVVTEVLRERPRETWLAAQVNYRIPLLDLTRTFAPRHGGAGVGLAAQSARHLRRSRHGAITCIDLNIEGDVGETLVCVEDEGCQHLVLRRVWSFSDLDEVYGGNRVLTEVEWQTFQGNAHR